MTEILQTFEFDIVKNTRNDIPPYYHTQEVVSRDSIEQCIWLQILMKFLALGAKVKGNT